MSSAPKPPARNIKRARPAAAKQPAATALLKAARSLRTKVNKLSFAGQVAWVYNPLDYAWAAHEQFICRFGDSPKRVLFLGMNPGPFGMMQTGVPFGEVAAVRDWMGIETVIKTPPRFHPKRPIQGFACTRSEVSGRRLWGWAANRFGSADAFFAQSFVVNYCPLVFLADTGRNLTPDKLPVREREPLQQACDQHLQAVIAALQPTWVVGVGGFAANRLSQVLAREIRQTPPAADETATTPLVGQILHPSPASPLANRGWEPAVDKQLAALGCFD